MRLVARKNYFSELSETSKDFVGAYKKVSLAFNLALQDIVTRYRGSVIGPWWITLTMGALVLGIGINYSTLFHVPVKELLPYVAFGMVSWSFISSTISEGGEAFVAAGAIIRQSPLPLPIFIVRCILRNLISLSHHFVIVVAVIFWFQIFPGVGICWLLLGLLLVLINLSWLILALASISTRFRDIPQIITALLQFVFFLSPIFWKPTPQMVGSFFVKDNPFYIMVEALREPLLKGAIPIFCVQYLSTTAFVGWGVSILLYNLTRRRIVHYL